MKRRFTATVIAVVTAITLMVVGAGQALASTGPNAANRIAASIRATAGSLAGPNPTSTTSPDNLLLVPNTEGVTPVQRADLTIWENVQPSVSYAERSLGDGNTQQFVYIAGQGAASDFYYNLRPGYIAKLGPNGGVLIYNSGNVQIGMVPAPYAKDATGKLVPASYSITNDGHEVVEHVEHSLPGIKYPVVADPIQILVAIWGAIILMKCAVNGSWEASQLRGQKWYVIAWRIAWVCVTG